MIEYQKEFCDDFLTVAEKARKVAVGNNEPVFFEFNEIKNIVYPDSKVLDIAKIYSLLVMVRAYKKILGEE